jgi:hypothetical protein
MEIDLESEMAMAFISRTRSSVNLQLGISGPG